ncbi:DUF3570 domain-containing protein [Flavobacterium sp. N3904]|uniref:DUF3570 domain-containing protein n=1 Tax=Flavobacterium sp. N3904 TaxID=2986835 RepID=UPI002224EA66|nr:DUF3570 domain-containing protein [Flavobacterium sp. N3904]
MKIYKIVFLFIFVSSLSYSQEKDTTVVFKKRVLESAEVDFMASYYNQDGTHSAVSGGIGSEQLTDFASNIVVSMPLNDDDVLTVDLGLSAYTSASSSNINPFNSTSTGASGGGGGDDDRKVAAMGNGNPTPWQASSGASGNDELLAVIANYTHNSDDRNFIWNADVSFSNEFDYTSFGFGGGVSKLFNNKDTEVSVKANAYIDQWRPIYPTELEQYALYGSNFQNQGYLNGVTILDQNGQPSKGYLPSKFETITSVNRNSYSVSFAFSQVVSKKFQFSVFFDLLQQQGLLSTPYHRTYFADNQHYYIGQPQYINEYTSPSNTGVYELADDIERLPDNRFKIPIGARFNYYINERFIVRTYYRYYTDDWNLKANTFNIEIPIKISEKFTAYPMYRYYSQTQSKYFAPYQTHLSTEKYYTSDYDLSTFYANQYGFGVSYTDLFTTAQVFSFGLKNIDFRFNHYLRSDGLYANIATIGFKFVLQ